MGYNWAGLHCRHWVAVFSGPPFIFCHRKFSTSLSDCLSISSAVLKIGEPSGRLASALNCHALPPATVYCYMQVPSVWALGASGVSQHTVWPWVAESPFECWCVCRVIPEPVFLDQKTNLLAF